jgi:hypothetical protein
MTTGLNRQTNRQVRSGFYPLPGEGNMNYNKDIPKERG